MQKLVVTLPKKMPLAMRISKASSQIREWLQIVDVAFNNEKDKLQLTKWELKNREYHYHYSIIKEKASSARSLSENTKLNFQTTICGIKRHYMPQYDVV